MTDNLLLEPKAIEAILQELNKLKDIEGIKE